MVPHGANGESHAFSLKRGNWRGVIMTDAIDVSDEVAKAWLQNLDFLVLGTSFADESGHNLHSGRSVYDIREALALPWAQQAKQVYLSHLSHDIDIRQIILPAHWAFAYARLTSDLKLRCLFSK